jgi:hypothetical protein
VTLEKLLILEILSRATFSRSSKIANTAVRIYAVSGPGKAGLNSGHLVEIFRMTMPFFGQ